MLNISTWNLQELAREVIRVAERLNGRVKEAVILPNLIGKPFHVVVETILPSYPAAHAADT